MKCPEEERIEMLLEGALDGSEAAEIESHLAGCAACAARLESLREIDAALRENEPPPPGEEYFASLPDRIRARLEPAGAADSKVTRAESRFAAAMWRLVQAAAVLALVFAFSAVYSIKSINPSGVRPAFSEEQPCVSLFHSPKAASRDLHIMRNEIFDLSSARDAF